jgi:predicted transcriptional regulator
MNDTNEKLDAVERTAEIVAAYVSNNTVAASDLGNLIRDVHMALSGLGNPVAAPEPLVPAVPVKKSVTNDYIVCLEDGKKFKTLKRHLAIHYGLTPQQYREKWGLPADYPMVAPAYAEARSQLAKSIGLGQKREAAPAPKAGRGRASKAAGTGRGRAKAAVE